MKMSKIRQWACLALLMTFCYAGTASAQTAYERMKAEAAAKDSVDQLDKDARYLEVWFGRPFARTEVAALSTPVRVTGRSLGCMLKYLCSDRKRLLGSVYFGQDEDMDYVGIEDRRNALKLADACRFFRTMMTPAELDMVVTAGTK